MIFARLTRVLITASVLAVFSGCAKADNDAATATTVATGKAMMGVDAWFPLTVGGKAVRVQVVVTMDEQQRGLMGRRDLGADDGMVFIYPVSQQMNFWMKNTPTALDIGFFTAEGVLGEVYPMYPYDETPVKSAGSDYTLALEMNQGWFEKNGVKPGAKLDHAQLAAALRARGFKPERYAVNVP
jgi:uncharacterized protein